MIANPKLTIHLLFHRSGLAVTCIQVLKTSHGFGIVFLIFFLPSFVDTECNPALAIVDLRAIGCRFF